MGYILTAWLALLAGYLAGNWRANGRWYDRIERLALDPAVRREPGFARILAALLDSDED
jgi:hypothetical protein